MSGGLRNKRAATQENPNGATAPSSRPAAQKEPNRLHARATRSRRVRERLLLRAEVAILDLAPLLACCDPDQGLIDRFLERAAGRERYRHIGGLENALGRPDRSLKAGGSEILQRADAVDDGVGFSAAERSQGGGQIIEGRVG